MLSSTLLISERQPKLQGLEFFLLRSLPLMGEHMVGFHRLYDTTKQDLMCMISDRHDVMLPNSKERDVLAIAYRFRA
jgi:hypothetical protein